MHSPYFSQISITRPLKHRYDRGYGLKVAEGIFDSLSKRLEEITPVTVKISATTYKVNKRNSGYFPVTMKILTAATGSL